MSNEITWIPTSIDVGWGCLAGKRCVIGGEGNISGLKIFGIHGWLDNANSFDTLAPYLPSGSELLVLDLPGHGQSDHLPDGAQYTAMNYTIQLIRAADKVGWDRFIILAHSMGAALSVIFTALFPERVVAMVNLDFLIPHQMNIKHLRSNIAMELKAKELRKEKPLVYSEQQAIERLLAARGLTDIDEDAALILLPRSARQVEGGYAWSHDHRVKAAITSFITDDNWSQLLACIKCPLLLILANQGLGRVAKEEAFKGVLDMYHTNVQQFEMVSVDGSHHVHLTHPERVAKPLVDFLQRVALEGSSSEHLKARL